MRIKNFLFLFAMGAIFSGCDNSGSRYEGTWVTLLRTPSCDKVEARLDIRKNNGNYIVESEWIDKGENCYEKGSRGVRKMVCELQNGIISCQNSKITIDEKSGNLLADDMVYKKINSSN